jgi:lipopolysaccharide heptosyltransferase II
MRIAQILPELNVGGVETGTVDLARALKRRGHVPYVISNGGHLVSELVKIGVPHLTLPVHKKSIWSLRLVREIAQFLEREQIDVIHARSRIPAWLAYLAVRRTNCDFVTTCHGYYSKHFMSRVMGWGKRVIVISHSIGRRMIDDFGVSPGKLRLIHRGVDLSLYDFDAEKYDRSIRRPLKIINVGRISPIKGHESFIRAIHLLSTRFPNIKAQIVGGPDRGKEAYYQSLQVMVQRLGLERKIEFLGVRRDVPSLVRDADLLVLSSVIPEGLGRVIIEAGASGTAVAASRIGGILDVIDEGRNGLLFTPENFEDMAITMEKLLRNRTLSKRVAQHLHEKVLERFNLEKMVDETLQVYEEVKQEKKILVTKLGALGDLVLAIPSFKMIRNRYPDAHISVLTDPKLMPLLENCPYVDDLIAFDRFRNGSDLKTLLKIGKWLRVRSFDMSIDLHHNWRTYLLTFLAQIPKRFGYRRGIAGWLLTHPVVLPSVKMAPIEHQFQVLRRAGITQLDDEMSLWTDVKADQSIAERLNRSQVTSEKPLIGLVVGASPHWPTKKWPDTAFAALAKRLQNKLGAQIVLLGTVHDRNHTKPFSEMKDVIDQIGKTDLSELVSLVKRLNVIVTGDTATLHIASAVRTKIVALFGPTDPARHMPPGNNHSVLVKHISCQPCYSGTCKNLVPLRCLKEISVAEVFDVVNRRLSPTPLIHV